MAPLVYLVTGANKGIGYEAVRILSERLGDKAIILLGTRSIENGKSALAKLRQANPSFGYTNVEVLQIDVSKSDSIQAAADFVRSTYGTLHVLINNAGITPHVEGVAACFQVNVFGVYETLSAFHPLMVPNQSINIVVASEVGAWTFSTMSPELQAIFNNFESIDIPTLRQLEDDWVASSEGKPSKQTWPTVGNLIQPYGITKTMVLALTRKWAKDHPDIKTISVCPGWCTTDFSHHSGPRSAAVGGESVVFPIFNPETTKSGGFYQDGNEHAFNSPMPAQFQ